MRDQRKAGTSTHGISPSRLHLPPLHSYSLLAAWFLLLSHHKHSSSHNSADSSSVCDITNFVTVLFCEETAITHFLMGSNSSRSVLVFVRSRKLRSNSQNDHSAPPRPLPVSGYFCLFFHKGAVSECDGGKLPSGCSGQGL